MKAMSKNSKYKLLAGLFTALLLSSCGPRVDESGNSLRTVREVTNLFDAIAQNEISRTPELATHLGLPTDVTNFNHDEALNDRSQAAFEHARLKRFEVATALNNLDGTPKPGSKLDTHLKTVRYTFETVNDLSSYGHGRVQLSRWVPYVADHLSGAYIDVPRMLIEEHPIGSAEAARNFVMRLEKFPNVLDDERRRLKADAESGVVPPSHILLHMVQNIEALNPERIDGDATNHPLEIALDNQIFGAPELSSDESERLNARGREILREEVLPAYQRYRLELTNLAAFAPTAPGVWQIPNGRDYYADIFDAYTLGGTNAEDSHRRALSEVNALTDKLDAALRAQGLETGTVAERFSALALQETNQATEIEDQADQANRLADINHNIQRAKSNLDLWFEDAPDAPLQVRTIPGFLEGASPSAYYSAARADGSAPSLLSINLTDLENWPRFALPTLVFHEAIPGHHLESSYAASAETPLLRRIIWLSAYGEGWSVYAEDLAAEAGFYQDDPLAEIGYLQSLTLRAARVVVDTGIHRLSWNREDAIEYMMTRTGLPETEIEKEVDRYIVWPGQAASYWIGRNFIHDLRRRAKLTLGPKFDQRAFHDAILSRGPRPLHLVQEDVERWYKSVLDE